MPDQPNAAPRCDFHDCALVEYRPHEWCCPIAALHDLADQFDQVYQANYAPAPTEENGVYHHARAVLARWRPMPDQPNAAPYHVPPEDYPAPTAACCDRIVIFTNVVGGRKWLHLSAGAGDHPVVLSGRWLDVFTGEWHEPDDIFVGASDA